MGKKTTIPSDGDRIKEFFERAREHARQLDRGEVIASKPETLREDIREGLDSGPSKPWSAAAIKREGRKRIKARKTRR